MHRRQAVPPSDSPPGKQDGGPSQGIPLAGAARGYTDIVQDQSDVEGTVSRAPPPASIGPARIVCGMQRAIDNQRRSTVGEIVEGGQVGDFPIEPRGNIMQFAEIDRLLQ